MTESKTESTNLRFTEKYRPISLNHVRGNTNIINCLKSFNTEDLPNMLFYGPPGTGKTTSIKALINGKISPINVLELNASDERGIDVVRNRIKQFAEASTEHRLVILDEADSMSRDAQGALRRIMEDYQNCRFCLICNYARKIIDPIQSRCAKFRFTTLDDSYAKLQAIEILKAEGIEVKETEGIDKLIHSADGDMRKLVNDIQGIKRAYGYIDKKSMNEFLGMISIETINEIFELLCSDSPYKETLDKILRFDIECGTIIKEIFPRILESNREDKFQLIKGMSGIEVALSIGCSNKIQTGALVGLFKVGKV